MKKMIIGLALSLLMGAALARSAVVLVEPERVALVSGASPLTRESVRQAIVKGGARHQWTVANDQPGLLQLRYIKEGKHHVVVDVSYDTTGFQIRYVSSTNMKYESTNGVPMIHPFYNKWVTNLSLAISAEASSLPTDK